MIEIYYMYNYRCYLLYMTGKPALVAQLDARLAGDQEGVDPYWSGNILLWR